MKPILVLLWCRTPPCTAIRFYSSTGSPLTVSKPFWAGGVHRGTFGLSTSSAVSCGWPCLTLLEPLCFSVHVLPLLSPPLKSVLFGAFWWLVYACVCDNCAGSSSFRICAFWCFSVLFRGWFRFACVTIAVARPPSESVLFGAFRCFFVVGIDLGGRRSTIMH